MRPAFYVPIQGTFSWDENPNGFQWWEGGSTFSEYIGGLGLHHLNPGYPFEWSTEIDGVLGKQKTTWKGAAKALLYYFGLHLPAPVSYGNRNLIAHSHGGQVAFFAAAMGLKIQNLVTVGTPVRADMEDVIRLARPNIGYWLHICDTKKDFMSLAGALFDGKLRIEHKFSTANKNDDCKSFGISHSKILNDPSKFSLWQDRGWAETLSR